MSAVAVKAGFDRAEQRRRAMLAKIHVGKKQLALDEDDYRNILMQETGHSSAGDCDVRELERVIRRFEALGFKSVPKSGARGAAQHPMARKARALWISLYHLGMVRSSTEKSLEAFAKRQLGCERLIWAKQSQGFRLIEALKKMAERGGWAQTDDQGNNLLVIELQEGLCLAILARLVAINEVPDHWTLNDAAFRLCGIVLGADGPVTSENYSDLAAALGRKLRDAGGAA